MFDLMAYGKTSDPSFSLPSQVLKNAVRRKTWDGDEEGSEDSDSICKDSFFRTCNYEQNLRLIEKKCLGYFAILFILTSVQSNHCN